MAKARTRPRAKPRAKPLTPQAMRAELLARGEVVAYRVKEALAYAGIGRTKLYAAIGAGKLPAYSRDGVTLILRDDLVAYVSDPSGRLPTKAAQ